MNAAAVPKHVPPPEVVALLARLNSSRSRIREEAKKELGTKTPEEMLALMQSECSRRLNLQHHSRNVFLGAYLVWVLTFAISWKTGPSPSFAMLALVGLLAGLANLISSIYPTRARTAIAQALEKRTEPAFLFAALEALANGQSSQVLVRRLFTTGMGRTEEILVPTIKRLLPMLRADQAALMTAEQRAALYAPLNEPYFDPELTVALLRALEQVGDYTAIPVVRKLASARSANIACVFVRNVAEGCLPALEQAEVLATPGGTLLRPAFSAEEELLRPAGSGVSEEAALLRPVNR